MKKVVALALGALMLSGCTVRVADMTVGSTKNYNLNAAKFEKGQRVTGEDKAPIVIFLLVSQASKLQWIALLRKISVLLV